MPAFEDQQALQQLLTGMNTMQMQSGLMPGGIPALNNNNIYTPPPVQTPAQFSNNLNINLQRTFQYQPTPPPGFGSVTPVPRTDYAPLPGPGFGGGWGAARQQAQAGAPNSLTSGQAVAGFGARAAFSTGVGAIAGTMTVNPWIGVAAGAGADMLLGSTVEKMAQLPFKPMLDQQQRAMQLQNMSLNNVRRGGDLSASGIGLSLTASMDLERNLMQMSNNRGFKRDTGNAFNRQDMMKITDLSSQVGLLDNAQGGDQIAREMGKIGRALASFMKVVEEPDVRKALQMMGNMRNMGMSLNETNAAASNARTFARMAGTTVQGVMQAGMQGANVFQQYGMSGATGMNIGMASVGTAGVLGTTMDPRTLGLLGGREGMAQSLTNSAAQVSQISAIMPALLKTGKDGRLTVDKEAVNKLLTGQSDMQTLVRDSAAKMTGIGAENFINQWSYRKSALQDEVMNSMGPRGGMMLPLILAKKMVDSGVTKDIGAALRGLGLDEKQAETGRQLLASGTIGDVMRQQQRTSDLEAQRGRAAQREGYQEAAAKQRWSETGSALVTAATTAAGAFLGGPAGATLGYELPKAFGRGTRAIGNIYDRLARENYGEDVDIEEQRIASGGGRILDVFRPGELAVPTSNRVLREQLQTTEGAQRVHAEFAQRHASKNRRGSGLHREIDTVLQREKNLGQLGINPISRFAWSVAEEFRGPGGDYGATALGRGGESAVDTANAHLGFYDRMRTGVLAKTFGYNKVRTEADVMEQLQGEKVLGLDIEKAFSTTSAERAVRAATAAGVDITTTSKFIAEASASVKTYVSGLQSGGGPLGFQGKTASIKDVNAKIDAAIAADPTLRSLAPDKKKAFRESMREEVIRTASRTMNAEQKATLHKLAGDGAESASKLAGGASRRELMSDAEDARRGALASLGVETGWGDDMQSARDVISAFSEVGPEGALHQKYLIAEALTAAAEAAGTDTKEGKALTAQAAAIRHRAESGNLTDADREASAKARAAAAATAGKMSEDHKVSMGKAFNKSIGDKTGEAANAEIEKNLRHISKTLGGAVADSQEASAVELFGGEDAAKAFVQEKDLTKAKAALIAYAKEHGGSVGGYDVKTLEGMTGQEIQSEIAQNADKGATGTFSEGLTQLWNGLTGPSSAEAAAVRNLEREGQKQKRLYNAADNEGKFAMTVDKFAEATAALKIAAADLSGKDSVAELVGTIQKSGFMETVEKVNSGFAGLFGGKG